MGTPGSLGLGSNPDAVTPYHGTLCMLKPEVLRATLTSLSLRGLQSSSREFSALVGPAPHPAGWAPLPASPAAVRLVLGLPAHMFKQATHIRRQQSRAAPCS